MKKEKYNEEQDTDTSIFIATYFIFIQINAKVLFKQFGKK